MQKTQTPIKKFVIVGGGTAGWLAGATLGNIFKHSDVEVELIESEDVNIIGVGEATIPPLIDTLESLGIDLANFISETQASFKWGIKFEDWYKKGHSYFHPFGELGQRIDGHEFYQCWLTLKANGDNTPLMAYSPEAVLSQHNRFFIPHQAMNTPLAGARFALHLDAVLAGKYLCNFAQKIGVKRTVGHIELVDKTVDGCISSVTLTSGQTIAGDFFIDCSGFNSVLIGKALNTNYLDWSEYLPCNRAVAVQTTLSEDIAPYTVSRAQEAGWSWHIPLQHRMGNGYVYSDKYISDEQATATLMNNVSGKVLAPPRVIPFKTGLREQVWNKNCLALGLAQGFLEPLESTAIHLVSKSLALFVRMFPTKQHNAVLQAEFNRRIHQDYAEIRDFLVLHYCTTQRSDSPFWRDWQHRAIPQTLGQRMTFFTQQGGLIPDVEALFQATSWYAVLDGMGVRPKGYNPTLDALDIDALRKSLTMGRTALEQCVLKQPSHAQFLHKYCPAKNL
ncbi:tryptophan halogenase family protein [Pseudoalteromonas sp. MMG022]|uniref:tryptophan halogenase family protein n=1 Tax=Pseudoalteromonas sp. MMG022 TaxID=2909978 RepID=UPI001F29F15C|nr:tryptophan halogenase family protein [Pseudoalteromonas sp. MMG022]MCF6434794.1 tryptophan 7-halogenase [Pseudoalteromonas sp. MMG022]